MHSATKKIQQGSALLVLVALILAAMSYVIVKALNSGTEAGRNEANAAVLSQAKQALIGFAATYKESHPNEAFGYLPCPDTINNDGIADPPCGNQNVSVIGRLPWNTLGIPPLRDSAGECLWYAVSGRAKDSPKRRPYSWDTNGQFRIDNADGAVLVAADTHDTPLAIVFAPGAVILGQDRALLGITECGGNITASNYLDGGDLIYTGTPVANANSTLTLATPNSIRLNTNNDQGQWITNNEIFNRVINRNDFPAYVAPTTPPTTVPNLLNAARDNLSFLTLAQSQPVTYDFSTTPLTETIGGTVAGIVEYGRIPNSALVSNDLKAWRDNLLYKRCTTGAGCLTVNGANCIGAVLFSGERMGGQTRISNPDMNNWNNYLEGTVLTNFNSNNTTFTSPPLVPTTYDGAQRSLDVIACITAPPAGSSQTTFAGNFGDFISAGSNITPNSTNQTVAIGNNPGGGNGCFWLPDPVAVAGKTVRAYYEYQFFYDDPTGGADRGNGITLDIMDGALGTPTASDCGLASNMGAFEITDGIGIWAGESFAIETDVHNDLPDSDPVENHTAIMAWGNLAHGVAPGSNGYLTTACNGTAAGCRASPANKFEESPTSLHNQRIEIHSGCNSTCSSCIPASHATNTYIKITAWVDCANCNDVAADSTQTPTVNRCLFLDPAINPSMMNTANIALTGGFRSGASIQWVTLSNFILRSE